MNLTTTLLATIISVSSSLTALAGPSARPSDLPRIKNDGIAFAKCKNTTDWTYYVDADSANLDYCRKNDGSEKEPAPCPSGKTNASNSGHDLCKASR